MPARTWLAVVAADHRRTRDVTAVPTARSHELAWRGMVFTVAPPGSTTASPTCARSPTGRGRGRPEVGGGLLHAVLGYALGCAGPGSGPDPNRRGRRVPARLRPPDGAAPSPTSMTGVGCPPAPVRLADPMALQSDRERDVVALLTEGLSYAQIARELYVTPARSPSNRRTRTPRPTRRAGTRAGRTGPGSPLATVRPGGGARTGHGRPHARCGAGPAQRPGYPAPGSPRPATRGCHRPDGR